MKAISLVGVVLLLLGVLSFVVPIPHKENHSIKIGDAKFGVQTEQSERLPIAASITLVAAGIVVLAVGLQKR